MSILDIAKLPQDELDSIIQELGDYKCALVMCRITLDAVLNSPDDAPLSILRPFLQTRLDDILKLGI